MGSRRTRHTRVASIVLAGLMVLGACSDSSGSTAPDTTLVEATTTTTGVPANPSGDTASSASGASTSTSAAPVVVVGLPVSVVFPDISILDPTLSLRTLAPGDLDRLEARFRQDERVDVFLDAVDARGVYENDQLIAVAVAVSVTPGAASTSGFVESFIAGATDGGVVSPIPVPVLDQELTSWLSNDTGHLLWSYENLFLIVSGRNLVQVRDVVEVIITLVLEPTTTPTTVPLAPCPDAGELDDADATSTTIAGTDATSPDSTTTTAPCLEPDPGPTGTSTTSTEAGA